MRAKADADPPRDAEAARTPSARAARRRWAALIKRVWQVDLEFVDDAAPPEPVWSAD